MRKYYKGKIRGLYFSDLKVNKDRVESFKTDSYVIADDVIFYKNFMGVIIEFFDDYPHLKEDEATDYLFEEVKYDLDNATNKDVHSWPFYRSSELTPYIVSREREKELKEQKKVYKKEKRSK